jgi:3-hydroxyacyl-CoA dehydrogenase
MAPVFSRVAVIGAGVMGSGIAAHVANAGVPVLLLDVVPDGASDPNALAAGAISRLREASPSPFVTRDTAAKVTAGHLPGDAHQLASCDWIIEAVVEDVGVKRALYAQLDTWARPDAVITSNTSTIPLAHLLEGSSPAFRRRFAITHFFNPPRWMRLLELVTGPETAPEVASALEHFGDRHLGKGVVRAKDTPGFIANRIGTFWMEVAVQEALALGMSVEDADAVCGKPMGVPATGIFGLLDLVGLDLMPHIAASFARTLPADDRYRRVQRDVPLVQQLIADGYTGRKGKGGFYRVRREADGRKVTEVVDLATGVVRPKVATALRSARARHVTELVNGTDTGAEYARRVLAQVLAYAFETAGEIADDFASVDTAMRLGFNWQQGPFELADALGVARVADWVAARGEPVPPRLAQTVAAGGCYRVQDGRREQQGADGAWHGVQRPGGVTTLADVQRAAKPLEKNGSAALWDLGDRVLGVEFRSKMNALDGDTMAMLHRAVARAGRGDGPFRAIVLHNEGKHFSVGANLGLLLYGINLAAWRDIEKLIIAGQQAYLALRYAPVPVVGAAHGMALGGGCEVLLHCDAVAAHLETSMGLVESGAGLVPGWGGCTQMLLRHVTAGDPADPMPAVLRTMEQIAKATTAPNAVEAQRAGFLRPHDVVVMNEARLLGDAKHLALSLSEGYRPPPPPVLRLPGAAILPVIEAGVQAMVAAGQATAHDAVVAGALARVLTGGDTTPDRVLREADLHALERDAFLRLVREPRSRERIEHLLATGAPLRN